MSQIEIQEGSRKRLASDSTGAEKCDEVAKSVERWPSRADISVLVYGLWYVVLVISGEDVVLSGNGKCFVADREL